MPAAIDVTAIYANGWNSTEEYDTTERHLVDNAPPAPRHGLVLGYGDVADLVDKVDQLLTIDPDHPCLRSLEIVAHGSPIFVDGLTRTDVSGWGRELKQLGWCDEANLYLSGCNTGLARRRGPPAARGPIARLLAGAMPFDPVDFPHKLTVLGTAGYVTGSHATGDIESTPEYSTGMLWWEVEYVVYPGARTASGSRVWNPFRNW
jgi:hypothetical protein